MHLRETIKWLAHLAATLLVLPLWLSYRVRALVLGKDRALEGSTQALALFPGLHGQYLRRAFLALALEHCHRSVTVEFGTIFSCHRTRLERNAYVGPRCHLGWCHLEENVLLAAGVHVPSGGRIHGTDRLDVPIREQPGRRECVRIGAGSWVGSAAVVMAHVGRDAVVAAGAVVVKPTPDRVVVGGVPARVLRRRDAVAAAESSARD